MHSINIMERGQGLGATRTPVLYLSLLLLLLTTAPPGVSSEAHPHRGVVKPFQSGDPKVKLNKSAISQLRAGKPYKTQIQDGSAGRGLVVQDVEAPVDIVWERILDFNRYNEMVPKTVESAIYKTENLGRGGKKRIWVRMKVGFPMLKLQFYINHLYDPANHSLTWTLDYNYKSDLDDSCGYWYVVPHPDDPAQKTRVFYSVEVSMFSWVPQFVVDFMSKQALTDATGWVKKYSEQEAQKKWVPKQHGDECSGESKSGKKGLLSRFLGTSDETCESDPTAVAKQHAVTEKTAVVRKIGITRYALVFTVLSLVLYNIHLYFSQ